MPSFSSRSSPVADTRGLPLPLPFFLGPRTPLGLEPGPGCVFDVLLAACLEGQWPRERGEGGQRGRRTKVNVIDGRVEIVLLGLCVGQTRSLGLGRVVLRKVVALCLCPSTSADLADRGGLQRVVGVSGTRGRRGDCARGGTGGRAEGGRRGHGRRGDRDAGRGRGDGRHAIVLDGLVDLHEALPRQELDKQGREGGHSLGCDVGNRVSDQLRRTLRLALLSHLLRSESVRLSSPQQQKSGANAKTKRLMMNDE